MRIISMFSATMVKVSSDWIRSMRIIVVFSAVMVNLITGQLGLGHGVADQYLLSSPPPPENLLPLYGIQSFLGTHSAL
ncbi:hypothetical protein M0R45_006012 [Rubus argutus]|uniref:Uncharacterized protein n=1 Tax=Rubus argutus TaxID=59490 RepID=A0AAW1YP79_RUBAR